VILARFSGIVIAEFLISETETESLNSTTKEVVEKIW